MHTHPMIVGTPRFQNATWFVLDHETEFHDGHEGDYSSEDFVRTEHDPADPGGTTRYGIDKSSQPKVDIENLTFDGAVDIYWQKYWRIGDTPMDALPPGIGEVMYDIHVNGGNAVEMAQRAAGFAGQKLTVDGNLGSETLAAVAAGGRRALVLLLWLRDQRYRRIAHGSLAKFLEGWINRNRDLAHFVGIEDYQEITNVHLE